MPRGVAEDGNRRSSIAIQSLFSGVALVGCQVERKHAREGVATTAKLADPIELIL